MPKGVASGFLRVLEGDVAAARRRLAVLAGLAAALFVPAWWLLPPWGPLVHGAALLVGAGAGLLAGQWAAKRYEAALRSGWQQWMEFAAVGESVQDIHRRSRGRSARNLALLAAAGLTAVWALETLVLTLALLEGASVAWAGAAVAANGLAVGGMLGHRLRVRGWTKALRGSIQDMLRSGEIGIWGVR